MRYRIATSVLVLVAAAAFALVVAADDANVLLDFYRATNGPMWNASCRNVGWESNTTTPHCRWSGITCNIAGQVTSIELNNCQLSGTLPASLSALDALEFLRLSSNEISGSLPTEWSNLTALRYIVLNINQLSGVLPSSWSNISSLREIHLYGNFLAGSLPETWADLSSVRTLNLRLNEFNGSLPASWATLQSLEYVYLGNNRLVGTLPPEWSAWTSVRYLGLNVNLLNGTIPASWSNMSALEDLHLFSNSLSGTLPATLARLSTLVVLNLRFNCLHGSLPHDWCNISKLEYLYVNSNRLSGSLPDAWSRLARLIYVALHDNELNNTLPTSWSSLSNLQELHLYNNKITGTLPAQWAAMLSLRVLNLRLNQLSGSLPHDWSNMSKLETLNINSNGLSGSLPSGWSRPPMLRSLLLQNNSLCGTVPKSWALLPAATIGSIDLTFNHLQSARIEWYDSSRFRARVLVGTNQQLPASRCGVSWTDSASLSRSALSTSSTPSRGATVSLDRSSISHMKTHSNNTFSRQPSVTASSTFRCAVEECGLVPLEDPTTMLPSATYLLLEPEFPSIVSLRGKPIAYSTIATSERIVFRVKCAAYPWPLHIRDAYLWDGVGQGRLLSMNITDSMAVLGLVDEGGWLGTEDSFAYRQGNVLRIKVTVSCDGAKTVDITAPVLSETLPPLEGVTAAISLSAQWLTVATGSAGVAMSVGRIAAARRVLLCSNTGTSYGGLLGLSIYSASSGDSSAPAAAHARGALVGNTALLVAVGVLLVFVAFLYCRFTGSTFKASLLRLALPSSLLPVWIATVQSSAAAVPMVVNEWGYVALGTIALAPPLLLLALVPTAVLQWWRLEQRAAAPLSPPAGTQRCSIRHIIRRSTRRTSLWRVSDTPTPHRCAWVVLLEYKALWFPAMDASVLLAASLLSAASGLGGVSQCRAAAWTIFVLYAVQLVVCVATRPWASLASNVCGILCLLLTCVSAVMQCVAVENSFARDPAPHLSLLYAVFVLELAVIGISVARLGWDVLGLLRSIRRLLSDALNLRLQHRLRDVQLSLLVSVLPDSSERVAHGRDDDKSYEAEQLNGSFEGVNRSTSGQSSVDDEAAEGLGDVSDALALRRLLLYEELAQLHYNE